MNKQLGIIKSAKFGMVDHFNNPVLKLVVQVYGGEFLGFLECSFYQSLFSRHKIEDLEWLKGKPCVVEQNDHSGLWHFVDLYV